MESLAFWFSPSGRIAPKPFARGILAVYGAAALSLLLMSAPVMLRVGFAPFALVQALACWAWFCLHAKRLRDAGRDPGMALAVAVIYALAIVLLLLVLALAAPLPGGAQVPAAGAADAWSDLFALAGGDSDLGLFGYVGAGMLALIVLPMLTAVAFSIWAATRPGAAAADPP
jgi:uncharacterized membrane protein YhaH (DUF805 family)